MGGGAPESAPSRETSRPLQKSFWSSPLWTFVEEEQSNDTRGGGKRTGRRGVLPCHKTGRNKTERNKQSIKSLIQKSTERNFSQSFGRLSPIVLHPILHFPRGPKPLLARGVLREGFLPLSFSTLASRNKIAIADRPLRFQIATCKIASFVAGFSPKKRARENRRRKLQKKIAEQNRSI